VNAYNAFLKTFSTVKLGARVSFRVYTMFGRPTSETVSGTVTSISNDAIQISGLGVSKYNIRPSTFKIY
jgi:hypothetical protein